MNGVHGYQRKAVGWTARSCQCKGRTIRNPIRCESALNGRVSWRGFAGVQHIRSLLCAGLSTLRRLDKRGKNPPECPKGFSRHDAGSLRAVRAGKK